MCKNYSFFCCCCWFLFSFAGAYQLQSNISAFAHTNERATSRLRSSNTQYSCTFAVIAIGYNIRKLPDKTFCETEISGLFVFSFMVFCCAPHFLLVRCLSYYFIRPLLSYCCLRWRFGLLHSTVSSLIYHCVCVQLCHHSFPFLSFAHLLYGSTSTPTFISTAAIHMKSTCHTIWILCEWIRVSVCVHAVHSVTTLP